MAGWDHEIYFRSRLSTQRWPTDASLRSSHFMQEIADKILYFFRFAENGLPGIRRNLQRAAFRLATKSYNSGVITLPICLVKHIYQWYLLPIRSISTLMITPIYSFKNIVLYNGRTCSLSLVKRNYSSSKFCSAVLFWHSSIDVAVRIESDSAYMNEKSSQRDA